MTRETKTCLCELVLDVHGFSQLDSPVRREAQNG